MSIKTGSEQAQWPCSCLASLRPVTAQPLRLAQSAEPGRFPAQVQAGKLKKGPGTAKVKAKALHVPVSRTPSWTRPQATGLQGLCWGYFLLSGSELSASGDRYKASELCSSARPRAACRTLLRATSARSRGWSERRCSCPTLPPGQPCLWLSLGLPGAPLPLLREGLPASLLPASLRAAWALVLLPDSP